jgi:uncharacterized protein YbbC (DUF1343 family)
MLLERLAVLILLLAVCGLAMAPSLKSQTPTPPQPVVTGAEVFAASHFAAVAGKRVGLITNQTGRVHDAHLADLLHAAAGVTLAAIFAPEHGFRGAVEAGAAIGNDVDAKTGVPIYSLYGDSRQPTAFMLRNVDVMVFDIQDVGARFYTYISTMGLAMQAAAAARIPFIVLDRPNPLGGDDVSGFVLEPALRSFVGQYPIPIVHGMTVGELARMIKGERWLDGLDALDLKVIAMQGWQRSMRWPQTRHAWVATSPNIPSFESALVYPGMGIVGETEISEGRGTPTPFQVFGAPWLDATRLVKELNAKGLSGVRFETTTFTPRSIPAVAQRPRYEGQTIDGAVIVITNAARVEPLEIGIHVLSALFAQAQTRRTAPLLANVKMFHAIAGTKRLYSMLAGGSDASTIVASWQSEVAQFKVRRARYLLY